MKKIWIPVLSVCLCCVLLVSVGIGCFALTSDSKNKETPSAEPAEHEPNLKNEKDETVYVMAGADGTVHKIIVSDWIRNPSGSKELTDTGALSQVTNVKGDESFKINPDGMRVWDADGKDIYCQGMLKKDLPVDLSVSYTWNGKKADPASLAGKSGHLVIRYTYQNNQYEMVEIDGKKEKIYVPFVMLTGILLENDQVQNVKVTNGRILQDGSRTAVIGMAFPGMADNLRLDESLPEIPDYVEISADVKGFELGTTITLATNEPFSRIDAHALDDLNTLPETADLLSSAMAQLLDGSSALYNGLCTLLEKSDSLIAGINQLAAGAEKLKAGVPVLQEGAGALDDGAAALCAGLQTLTQNNDSLTKGAEQIFASLLEQANVQIDASGLKLEPLTAENYSAVLNGAIASLRPEKVQETARQTVTEEVEKSRPLIEQKVTEKVHAEVKKKVTAVVQNTVKEQATAAVREKIAAAVIPVVTGNKMNKASYDAAVQNGTIDPELQKKIEAVIDKRMNEKATQSLIQFQIDLQMKTPKVKNIISAKTEEQMQTKEIQALITAKTEEQVQSIVEEQMQSEPVQAQIRAAAEGLEKLCSLKASLDQVQKFCTGVRDYTEGVTAASQGAAALKDGTARMQKGLKEFENGVHALYDGILELKNNTPALKEGVTQLRDGSMQLSGGLKEFNEKGMKKIVDLLKGDVSDLILRVRATVDVSGHYNSFSGLSDQTDGQVRFVYRTDSIRKPAEKQ